MDEQRFRVIPSCLVIVWLVALGTAQTPVPGRGSECYNYKELSSADRAQGNTAKNGVRCDDLSTPGWYRFIGAAGNQIPDACVPVIRCGTMAPGWLNGTHPTVQDGVVTRTVCYHWWSNCCHWNNTIKVRNCGAYYVYELQRTPTCFLRYCGNGDAGNECYNYKVLSSADRSQGNTAQNGVRCDQHDLSTPGWYRFMGAAGNQIPDACVPMKRCGTMIPGWFNGTHPTVQDGVVTRRVCYHWRNNCCFLNNNIKVKNCGGYFVYELQGTPACIARYCGNADAAQDITEDATLSDWSPFTNCSVSCGSGFKTRYRTCNRSRFGGKNCSSFGALTEQQPCNVHNCSVGNVDIVDLPSEEKQSTGLRFKEITIVSAGGSVLLICLLTTLAVILFKKHRERKPNIPDKKEITPYATVRISGIFALNGETNRNGLPAMNDDSLQILPLQPRIPHGERPTGQRELRYLPYENIDRLGRPAANPLEHLLFHPRYENEEVDNETRDVLIRPGYDKLAPGTREKRRENDGTRRLPCGMVDKHGQSVYDSLIRETDRSRTAELSDSDSDHERNIPHTILEEPSCDERSPACSMDRRRNGEGNSKQSSDDEISLEDIQLGCIGNDWKTCEKQGEVQPLTFKISNGNSPRSQAAFKMEDQTGLFHETAV